MSNFVTIGKGDFEHTLATIDANYQLVSGNEDQTCWEYVYEVDTPVENVAVRIYSTVDKRTGHTRDKGQDAIRIVHWDTLNDRPVGKGKKILRVEGATTVGDRIAARIADLVANADTVEIMNWDYVRAVLEDNAPFNNFAGTLLGKLDEWGSLTDGQLAYVLGDVSPKGWPTMEAKSKSKNPDFWANYLKMAEDTDDNANGGENGRDIAATSAHRTLVHGVTCEICGMPVYDTPSGFVCEDGHGGIMGEEPEVDEPITTGARNIGEISLETLPTSEYPFWNYPFPTFNPVQTSALGYASINANLIVGANTSAGKTVCAEFAMDHTLAQPKLNRVIYLSPLKSLTQEKYEDWQARFPGENITILTGDYVLSDAMKEQLAVSNIIVMTSEMCDSRTRRMHTEKNFWLKEVGLVIVDESHILSTGRGHAVESGLMRFSRINKNARILFLSATMPNCDELAKWLTKLNGKASNVVYSTWRPVVLEMNYVDHPVIIGQWGRPDYWATQEAKRQLAVDIAMGEHVLAPGKEKEKFLIFCHDKGTGRNIVKRLGKLGVEAHFHNADLDLTERLEVERLFADRDNGIRILVSTSTLAWGRNLPARNVIIVGVHRGLSEVDELDIIQMAGRAGRYGIDDAGTVYLLTPEGTGPSWANRFANPRPVRSGFVSQEPGMEGGVLNRHVLAFHLLAEIENRAVGSVNELFRWYQRSLAHHQEPDSFGMPDAQGLLDDLRDMEMVEFKGNYVKPFITGLGRVSAWLYFSPYDVYGWYSNFSKFFEDGTERDDLMLAWALTDIDSNNWGYIPADLRQEAEEYQWKLRNRGVQASDAVIASIAAFHCLKGQDATGTTSALMRGIRYDIRRVSQALALIDSMYTKWEQKGVWETLASRIMYGVSEEIVELTKVPGIGGATARKLYDRGIKTLMDLAAADNLKVVMQVAAPARAKKFMFEARKLI